MSTGPLHRSRTFASHPDPEHSFDPPGFAIRTMNRHISIPFAWATTGGIVTINAGGLLTTNPATGVMLTGNVTATSTADPALQGGATVQVTNSTAGYSTNTRMERPNAGHSCASGFSIFCRSKRLDRSRQDCRD